MSRRKSRARRRSARIETALAEFGRAREEPEAFAKHLKDLADNDTPIWPIAETASKSRPLDDAERDMIAQAVAPHLVRMTPPAARRRVAIDKEVQSLRRLATVNEAAQRKSQVSSIKPGG